jgi:predicted nucleic acid-binding protein
MKIISNTGPIIALAKIGLLFILNQMASEVLIPPMVHKELLGEIGGESEQIEKALKEFIHVKDFSPGDPTTENAFQTWMKAKDKSFVSLPPLAEMFWY